MKQDSPSRLFILGAGFSKPAGLPLGSELLREIVSYVNKKPDCRIFHEYRNLFTTYLNEYKEYSKKEVDEIHIEEFIEYIDYQNFLKFSGGLNNNIQEVIRVLIATALLKKQQKIQNKELYEKFAEILTDEDIVITLNYDTLLEKFLNKKGKKFRLLPPSIYKSKLNYESYNGVTVLKVHGSINWFSLNEYYEMQKAKNLNNPHSVFPYDFIFNNHGKDKPTLNPLLPLNIKSTIETNLKYLYWISDDDLNKFIGVYNDPFGRIKSDTDKALALTHPVILSPSYAKLLYSDVIKDLFYGAGFYGRANDQIIIIGCSLPDYDRYIKQWIFDIVRQYNGMQHLKKISVINFADTPKGRKDIRKNYSYLNLNKDEINFKFDGLSIETILQVLNN